MQKASSNGKSKIANYKLLLRAIVAKLSAVCTNAYADQLFTAAYCLIVYGFFIIGEITFTEKEYIHKIVQKMTLP